MRHNTNRFKKVTAVGAKWLTPSLLAGVLLLAVVVLFLGYNVFGQPDYQKKQEYFVKSAKRTLTKILGRHNYIVNISLQYAETSRKIQKVHYTPRQITEKYETSTSEQTKEDYKQGQKLQEKMKESVRGEDKSSSKSSTSGKDSAGVEAIRKREGLEKLPGLIPRKRGGHKDDLPGFPKVKPSAIQSNKYAGRSVISNQPVQGNSFDYEDDLDTKVGTTAKDQNNIQSQEVSKALSSGTEKKESKFIVKHVMDENKETITIPESKVDKMYVSLVLNSDRLTELNLTRMEVANILQSVIGFYPERGDSMYITAFPFKGLSYALKKSATFYKGFASKNRILLMIIFGIPIGIFVVLKLIKLISFLIKRQSSEKETIESQKQMEQAEEAESKYTRAQDEILSLAKNKPEDFAKALVDWIEKVDIE